MAHPTPSVFGPPPAAGGLCAGWLALGVHHPAQAADRQLRIGTLVPKTRCTTAS